MDSPEKLVKQATQYEEKHNTICVGHQYTQTNTNNVNKTWAIIQTTAGKRNEYRFYEEIVTNIKPWKSENVRRHNVKKTL